MGPISNPINENLEALQVPHPWEPHDLSRSGAFLTCCTKVLCGRPNFFCSGLCLRFSFCLDSSLYNILGLALEPYPQRWKEKGNPTKAKSTKELGTPRLSPLLVFFGTGLFVAQNVLVPCPNPERTVKWNLGKKKTETIEGYWRKVKTPNKTMQKGRPYAPKGAQGVK